MPPLVSVIIPCFRQGHLLPTAIESALGQSHPSVEVLVVNDGSDDDTDAVTRRYAERIRYISQANAGLPAARNAGIAAAAGRYLHFLDADDALHPEALAWMTAAAAERDDVLVAIGWRYFRESPADGYGETHLSETATAALPTLLERNLGPPHSYLSVAAAVRRLGGFDTALRSCEDWDLWLRLALAGARLVVVPRVGAYYRRYSGSMSTNRARMLQTRSEVLLRAHRTIVASAALRDAWGPRVAEIERRVLHKLLAQGGDRTAQGELFAALEECHRFGFGRETGWRRRLLRRLLGRRADSALVQYWRVCQPRHFAWLLHGQD